MVKQTSAQRKINMSQEVRAIVNEAFFFSLKCFKDFILQYFTQ